MYKKEKGSGKMTRCEGCGQEKEVMSIESRVVCKECEEDIVRCDLCNRLLAVSFDELETNNFGRLTVPELSLPDKQQHLVFCNLDCLESYLKKYRQELKELDRRCNC